MPVLANKRRKKASNKTTKIEQPERSTWIDYTASASAGAILGLSAPGFDQWYLAWIGLVPLIFLSISSRNLFTALLRGFAFGAAYNLVYLNWYLGLYPLNWLGFNEWQSLLLAVSAWLITSMHQGLIVGLFSTVCRMLPLTGGFLPRKLEERWHLPALIVLPLSWVLINNKIGNAHDALGVPWSMLEYSQYQQLPIIQAASWIGGIGIGCLIVASNSVLAEFLATVSRKASWKALAAKTSGQAIQHLLGFGLVIAILYAGGLHYLSKAAFSNPFNLAVVQGNVNIDMQKTVHRFTLAELLDRYKALLAKCPNGVCVFTESALPTYLRNEPQTISALSSLARAKQLDLLIGSMDRQADKPYNSAFGINSHGQLLKPVYHKRYLVPFGEYTPYLVQYLPAELRRLTNTPSGAGFAAGKDPVAFSMAGGKIAPLICFETLSPELVSESVRAGGQLLVNISDLAWFHDSMIGQQMLSFAVLRAVESRRYFVFAANSGPSAIVDPTGKITSQSKPGRKQLLLGKAGFVQDISPFTFWFK